MDLDLDLDMEGCLAGFGKVWLTLAFFFPAEGSSQLRYHEGAWIPPLAAFGLNDTYGCSSPGNPSPAAALTEDHLRSRS